MLHFEIAMSHSCGCCKMIGIELKRLMIVIRTIIESLQMKQSDPALIPPLRNPWPGATATGSPTVTPLSTSARPRPPQDTLATQRNAARPPRRAWAAKVLPSFSEHFCGGLRGGSRRIYTDREAHRERRSWAAQVLSGIEVGVGGRCPLVWGRWWA